MRAYQFGFIAGDIRVTGEFGTVITGGFGRSVSFQMQAGADLEAQEGVEQLEISLRITSDSLSEPVFVLGSAFITVIDMTGNLASLE